LERELDLKGVVAGRNGACIYGDFLLIRERARVVGAIVLDGSVENDERFDQSIRARHLVFENHFGARARGAAAENRVGEKRETRVAFANCVFELVDFHLEIAKAHSVGRAVHRGFFARSGCGRRRYRRAGILFGRHRDRDARVLFRLSGGNPKTQGQTNEERP